MLQGEAPNGRRVGGFLFAMLAAGLLVVVLSDYRPDNSFLAATDLPHELTLDERVEKLEAIAVASAHVLEAQGRVFEAHDVDLAAAAASVLMLQSQLEQQARRIAALELALASATVKAVEPLPPRRPRKPVPDPPASSYLNLR